jgi:hypothetical protein
VVWLGVARAVASVARRSRANRLPDEFLDESGEAKVTSIRMEVKIRGLNWDNDSSGV